MANTNNIESGKNYAMNETLAVVRQIVSSFLLTQTFRNFSLETLRFSKDRRQSSHTFRKVYVHFVVLHFHILCTLHDSRSTSKYFTSIFFARDFERNMDREVDRKTGCSLDSITILVNLSFTKQQLWDLFFVFGSFDLFFKYSI